MAINTKRWAQARYMRSRARGLVSALPADQTIKEREQHALLRGKIRGARHLRNQARHEIEGHSRGAGGRQEVGRETRIPEVRAEVDSRPRRPLHQPCRSRLRANRQGLR
nr:hypothetical protein [Streptomyces antimycoticus]